MEIYLVRHAKSSHKKRFRSDSERPLTKKGIARQKKVIKNMQSYEITYQKVWLSPLKRSQQTFALIEHYFGKADSVEIRPELEPMADPSLIVNLLKEEYTRNPELHLLLVGHNPHLSNLLRKLVGENSAKDMKTSDTAWIRWTPTDIKLIKFFSTQE